MDEQRDKKKNLETILIVDDDPLNLTILNNLLKEKYAVKVANNGTNALKVANSDLSIDLILLDIIMPDIMGYEVCEKLKENSKLKDVPIIFTSALSETHEIVKGFQVGGVDYITKPFHPEEVNARVEVHLELKRAKNEIQSLLSKTLVGSVRLLIDVLTFSQPHLVQQSYRVRKYAKAMVQKLNLDAQESWSIELSTMLSHIGCIAVPKEVMDKVNKNQKLTTDELLAYNQYPVLGAKLLDNIPRLERTASIIKNQLANPNRVSFSKDQPEYLGSELLNLLIAFDSRLEQGEDEETAFHKAVQLVPRCPSKLFMTLKDVIEDQKGVNEHVVNIDKLIPGMVLAADVNMKNGMMLLTKDTELNMNLIDMLRRLNQQEACHTNVKIYSQPL